MEISDAIDFLSDENHAVLVTIKRNGRPQTSNIAYAIVDGAIRISVTDGRAKTANLRRDSRATLHVSSEDFRSYVALEADVELSPVAADPDDETVDLLVDYFRAVAGEHDDWPDYRRAMVADRRLVLTLRPTHAYGLLSR